MTNQLYVDQQGDLHTLADRGVTWASSEQIATWGWKPVPPDYRPPQPAPTKEDKVAAINTKYDALYADIREKIGTATALNNQTAVASFQAKYKQAVAAHKAEKEAVLNG